MRSPDLGNWTRPEKTLVTHDRPEKRLRRKPGNILLIYHEPLCNASSFNKAVLKLVENRKLLPHFLSRRARHGPNKKTILCPLGMVSRPMSLLIGCLTTVGASYWPRMTALVIPIILKEKNIFLFNLDFPRLVGQLDWAVRYKISGIFAKFWHLWGQDLVPGDWSVVTGHTSAGILSLGVASAMLLSKYYLRGILRTLEFASIAANFPVTCLCPDIVTLSTFSSELRPRQLIGDVWG